MISVFIWYYRHQDSTGNYANPTQTFTSTCLFFQLCHFLCLSQYGTCSHFRGLLVACELYRGILRPVTDSAILLSWVHYLVANTPSLYLTSSKSCYSTKLYLRFKHNIIAMIIMYFISCHPPSEKFSDFATFLPFPYCLGINQNNGLYLCSDLWVLIGFGCIISQHMFVLWQGEDSFLQRGKQGLRSPYKFT